MSAQKTLAIGLILAGVLAAFLWATRGSKVTAGEVVKAVEEMAPTVPMDTVLVPDNSFHSLEEKLAYTRNPNANLKSEGTDSLLATPANAPPVTAGSHPVLGTQKVKSD